MRHPSALAASRRRFLSFLAASPLLAMGSVGGGIQELLGATIQNTGLIDAPDDAINVFDFEAVARGRPPASPLRIYGDGCRR